MEKTSASAERSIYFQRCFFGSLYIAEDLKSAKRYFKQIISSEEFEQMDAALKMQFKCFKQHLCNSGPHELVYAGITETEAGTSIYYEYCNGLTLFDRLARLGKGFDISDTFSTIKGVLAYFLYYEDKGGVFHHDVKLENIYIDHQSQIKIGGQDLAQFGGSLSGSISGCASYLAPEVFSAMRKLACGERLENHSITLKAEIFSLGVLTLELLTGSTFKLTKNDPTGKEPTNFLEYIHQVEDIQQYAQNALESTGLFSLHAQFYSVIKSMLEPLPEKRCNFSYLYEFFGLRHQVKSMDLINTVQSSSSSVIGDKLGLLCDPTILMVAQLRKLYFMRVDHEFCLIQFLIYSSKEVWDLSNFNFGIECFDKELRNEFKIISCCLALRAMIYLDNLRSAVKVGVNLFSIKNFDQYTAHAIHWSDVDHILQNIQIEENSPVKTYFALILGQLEDQFTKKKTYMERLKVYLQPHISKSEKLYSLGEAAKLSIKGILAHSSLEILQILFEKFLRLIEDCFQEDSRFKFRHPSLGVFDWNSFLSERYPHMQAKVVLRHVRLPYPSTIY